MKISAGRLFHPRLVWAAVALLLIGLATASANGALSAPPALPFSSHYSLVYVESGGPGRFEHLRQVRPAAAPPTLRRTAQSPLAVVPTPGTCSSSSAHASPLGLWVALQINCEANTHTLIVEVASGRLWDIGSTVGADNVFLGWLPAGDEFVILVDNFVSTRVYRVHALTGQATSLAVPDGAYHVAFSPDGRQMLYSLSRGLGFGSETWLAAADGQDAQLILSEPEHITAFIQWSPDGQQLAYIRMPDSMVPFPTGELWLMNRADGEVVFLSTADAGHGYRPVWSPDGTHLAFVDRENPHDPAANEALEALVSNIYLVNVAPRVKTRLTAFENARVEQPAWSPDGVRIAFSVGTGHKAGLWVADVRSGQAQQITPGHDDRFPVWLANSGTESVTPTAPQR